MIRRTISKAYQINLSKQIRGELLKNEDVLLTVCPEGIIVSPLAEKKTDVNQYSVKAKFNRFGRLYIPYHILQAAKIERNVTVEFRGDGSLLLSPEGCFCVICGSDKNLRKIGRDQMICEGCLKKAAKEEGIVVEKNIE